MAFKNLLRGAAVAAFLASKVEAVDNGLAITPQMGCELALFPNSDHERANGQ
jgi:hypothetical protein